MGSGAAGAFIGIAPQSDDFEETSKAGELRLIIPSDAVVPPVPPLAIETGTVRLEPLENKI